MNAKPRKQSILTTTRPRTNAERLMLWRRRMDEVSAWADVRQRLDSLRADWRQVGIELGRLALLIAIWAGLMIGLVLATGYLAGTIHH